MYPAVRPNCGLFSAEAGPESSDVEQCVRQMLARQGLGRTRSERRSDERFPFPYIMYITPAGGVFGADLAKPAIPIVGKHLSKHGLDFYHRDALPDRHIVLSAEVGRDHQIQLLLDVTWCRFIRQGWYSSGGKFLGVVSSSTTARPQTQANKQDGPGSGLLALSGLAAAVP